MRYKKFAAAVMAAGFLLSGGVFLGGCGSSQQAAGQKQTIKVSTFKPFKSDTPIMREYTGSIMALQEVPVRSKVSGTVMEKYITGGQQVTEGQPLYRLDTRNYNSQLANAQAQAAQASANYENAATDLARYDQLIAAGAISQKVYDNQKAAVDAYKGAVDAAEAQVAIASTNLGDTIVTAPFNGKLSMDDVNIGTFATAGTTSLVTISSSDPIYVQFDMSENEYLSLNKSHDGQDPSGLGNSLKLRLSDGSIYGETGKIVQVNPSMSGGQLSMKASFPNPDNLLVPGMYAAVVSDNEIAKGSLLIPTKALVQLLNKDIVDVVVDGKIAQKAVKVGGTYGIYTIIESGLDENDVIVVDGQNKVQVGQAVDTEETTKDKLEQDARDSVKGQSGTAAKQ
ncbi:efflux RND transporter periplasmic adaptor subunit [uncultured Dialister sp.]|jgi:membrane fusion protein (multidrug efflux system)|uniref:efflux RND transporter periplasmic adaptor subunit n=1 Tax=uncultured Dialister sp. TaxID=278064 RepID=UPI0025FAA842|nr:efflux RND transporter periplasmic adaptor subunit [uncultured Dialister sp.]